MKWWSISVVLVILLAGSYWLLGDESSYRASTAPLPSQNQTALVSINGRTYSCTLALNDTTRALGLSNQASMPTTSGMLFVFEQAQRHAFWMKDMLFPLDIVWIYNNKVVDISSNLPTPSAGIADEQLQLYQPKTAANYVLEINAFEAKDVKIGDEVVIQKSIGI